MFNINTLKSNLSIVRPNLFYAELLLPQDVSTAWYYKNNRSNINSTFSLRCEASELPGKTIATSDDVAFGPTKKFAYETVYTDVNLQIIASEDMRERQVFELWMDRTVTNTSKDFSTYTGGLIKYYDSYASGRVTLNQINDAGKVIAKYTLYNAFPIQLSPMNLSWEETNTYQRFTTTITYRYHTAEFF